MNIKDVFSILNVSLDYVVQRNFHEIFDRENAEHAEAVAFRNGTLQGAYFMLGARAMGMDFGAMSGFNNQAVDEEFFAGTTVKSNFLCNIGYGDTSGIFQKLPRFDFNEVCDII